MNTEKNKAFIVQFLSRNFELLYDKRKNRVWKTLAHEFEIASPSDNYTWKEVSKLFMEHVLVYLDTYNVPEDLLRRIRFPYLNVIADIRIQFEDKPYYRKHRLGPKTLQHAKILVKYKLSKEYTDSLYEQVCSITTLGAKSLYIININDPNLQIGDAERKLLKRFCKKPIPKTASPTKTPLSHWITKRKPPPTTGTISPDPIYISSSDDDREVKNANEPVLDDPMCTSLGASVSSQVCASRGDEDCELPTAEAVANEPIDDGSLGSCTSPRLSDLPVCSMSDEVGSTTSSSVVHQKMPKATVRSPAKKSTSQNKNTNSNLDSVCVQSAQSSISGDKVFIIKVDPTLSEDQQTAMRMLVNQCKAVPQFQTFIDPDRMKHFNSITSTFSYD